MTADVTPYRENPPAPPETPSPADDTGRVCYTGGLIIVSTTAYAGGAYGTGYTEAELVAYMRRRRGHGRGC